MKAILRDQLVKHLRDALSWLQSNLGNFRPLDTKGAVRQEGLKALAELAFVVMHAEAWSSRVVQEIDTAELLQNEPTRWRRYITEQIEDSLYLEACRRSPGIWYPLFFPYLCLRGKGYQISELDKLYFKYEKRGYVEGQERPPFRDFELRYLLSKSGFRPLPDVRRHLENGNLLGILDALYLTVDDAYALTHTLFYATDLGSLSLPLNKQELEDLADILEVLIVDSALRGQWDLLGELLIVRYTLGMPICKLVEYGFQIFLENWRDDGAIPAKKSEVSNLQAGSCKNLHDSPGKDSDPIYEDWRYTYHTTLVGIMLAFTWLQDYVGRT